MQQLLVGVDVGCHKHAVAIGGPNGIVEQFEITHDIRGFEYFFARVSAQARSQKLPVVVGMEGTNGYARPLDQMVKARGYSLLNVNNLKLARFKEIFASPAKTDSIDAQQIVSLMIMAPFMDQVKESLQPVPTISEIEMQLKRLSRRRRQLVNEKVILQNRMQADLQSVCPGFLDTIKKVDAIYVLRFLSFRSDLRQLARLKPTTIRSIPGIGATKAEKLVKWQNLAVFGTEISWVGPMISEDATRILELKRKINSLETQMKKLVEESALATLLVSIPGFGVVCAAEVGGEIGTMSRFDSEAGLAIYLGMAPLDNSSGKYKGTKSPRQVNKRAEMAMMTALGHHVRIVDESKLYYKKKRDEGKTYNQSLRSLGRHLIRVIWSMVQNNRPYKARKETLSA
ncbi:IS110 family transposase [Pelosinus sp. IPA-1]|uniref:IS110 family transposase n=1 Tax=Pelosinus sp. IPA-1 TaxID=3029569 RepID=UPI0024361FB4|nr:IS110 family transposase [Pelosinus sp. IPA-1]GMA99892.1 IS110 family transposase [Pelosinus sp. IPA-1]